MNVNPFSLIGDKIDKKDIFVEFKGVMGDDIASLDFNDYTTNGWYENTGTNQAGTANAPHNGDNGYLLVVSKSRTVYQFWFSTYQGYGVIVRKKFNGTWYNWGGNNITTYGDISSYNSPSNRYTFPSDGYVNLAVGSGQNGTAEISGTNEGNSVSIGKSQGNYGLYVKRGMKVYVSGTVNGLYFLPLS